MKVSDRTRMDRDILIESEMEVHNCDGDPMPIRGRRFRNSEGFRGISLQFGDQKIEISDDMAGDNYEQVAFELARILNKLGENSCKLPEIKE